MPLCAIKVSDDITAPAVAGDMLVVGSEDGTLVALGAAADKEEVAK